MGPLLGPQPSGIAPKNAARGFAGPRRKKSSVTKEGITKLPTRTPLRPSAGTRHISPGQGSPIASTLSPSTKRKGPTPYNLYKEEKLPQVLQENPHFSPMDGMKRIADAWRTLSISEKRVYEIRAEREKEALLQSLGTKPIRPEDYSSPREAFSTYTGSDLTSAKYESGAFTIHSWLKQISRGSGSDMSVYAQIFEAHKFTAEMLPLVSYESLSEMGIPIGPRLWILDSVSKLRPQVLHR